MAAAAPAKPKELLTELAAPVKREEGAEVEAEAEPLFQLAYIQCRSIDRGIKILPRVVTGGALARGSGDHGDRAGTLGSSARGTLTGGAGGGDGHLDSRVGDGGNAGGHRDNRGAAGGDLDRHNGAGGTGSRAGRSRGGAAGGNLNGSDRAAGRSLDGSDGAAAGSRSRAGHSGDGRGDSLNSLGGGSLTAGAVGDGGATRGDGHILGGVDGLEVTVGESDSNAGEEGNGSSSETHLD